MKRFESILWWLTFCSAFVIGPMVFMFYMFMGEASVQTHRPLPPELADGVMLLGWGTLFAAAVLLLSAVRKTGLRWIAMVLWWAMAAVPAVLTLTATPLQSAAPEDDGGHASPASASRSSLTGIRR